MYVIHYHLQLNNMKKQEKTSINQNRNHRMRIQSLEEQNTSMKYHLEETNKRVKKLEDAFQKQKKSMVSEFELQTKKIEEKMNKQVQDLKSSIKQSSDSLQQQITQVNSSLKQLKKTRPGWAVVAIWLVIASNIIGTSLGIQLARDNNNSTMEIAIAALCFPVIIKDIWEFFNGAL